MYAGEIIECGPVETSSAPRHPYTRLLFAATPDLWTSRAGLHQGRAARLNRTITGCPFRPRCDPAFDRCATEPPVLKTVGDRMAACHLNDQPAGRRRDRRPAAGGGRPGHRVPVGAAWSTRLPAAAPQVHAVDGVL